MTYSIGFNDICTIIDSPVTINGNPIIADLLEFSNKSNIDDFRFLYRLTKVENGIKKKDLFKLLNYNTKSKGLMIYKRLKDQNLLELTVPITVNIADIKNLKKVGVMTSEDSWLDETSCTFKRIGSSCENEEIAAFYTIPSELANKDCEKIYYNIYDLFYTCDYNDSISESGFSGPITTNTTISTSTSSSKVSAIETDTTINPVSEKNLFYSKSFIILSIGVPVLIILAVFPLVHYFLVTKPKLKAKTQSESSSVFSEYTQSTNDTYSSEITDKDSSDSTTK